MALDPNQWLDRARALWNERAEAWDEMSQANAGAAGRRRDLDRTAGALRLAPGSTLLDAGCGTGQFAVAFAALGCRVTGVDLAPEMLARARRHAAEQGVVVDFREGDLAHLPDADDAFDAVHARVSLHLVPDPAATLREIRRVLRRGGRLYASVPGALSPIYGNAWRRLLDRGDVTTNRALPWEMERLLAELGWKVVDGWGGFGSILGGDTNAFTAEQVATLDRRLQQAAATTWALMAE